MSNAAWIINPTSLWDIAGVDGLQVMKALVGPQVDRIAPFQSLETQLDGVSCSILRLCEGNFRLRWPARPTRLTPLLDGAIAGQRVWVQNFPWLGSIQLPPSLGTAPLSDIAIPKPPFYLRSLAPHCATPARVESLAVLIWRHPVADQDMVEIHAARSHLPTLERLLTQRFGNPQPGIDS